MSNLSEESGLGYCITCFSKFENYLLSDQDEESQKIVNNCWNYLHENIANSKLQIVKSENENEQPLCKKCFDAASELIQLSEHMKKCEKQISDLKFEFQLGVLARRTQAEGVNNIHDGQNSPKEFIVLDVTRISPSLFSTDQPNPTEMDDFATPCKDNFVGMDAVVNDPQFTFEIVKHEPEEAVDDESAKSEDDPNIIEDEQLPAHTRPVVILRKLKESSVSEKFDSSSPQHLSSNASSLELMRNQTSKEKFGETSSNITKDKELLAPAHTRPVVVRKELREAYVSEKFNCKSSPQQPPSNASSLKHGLNGTSKKKCGQSFSSNIRHSVTGNGNLKRGKMSVSSMKVRGRVDTGKKEHKCQECGKIFSSPCDLKQHIRVHTGERPFKCSFCEKAFNQASNLKTHERLHTGTTGKRPFKCVDCTKEFFGLINLKEHERIHTGEKPFKCSFCTKRFRQAQHLKTHIRIHTGEKPYKCSHCTKTFAHSNSLKNHLQVHKGDQTSLI